MNILNKVNQEYLLVLFLVIIISPIYINYDPLLGINFDSYYWNKYTYSSIPLSFFIITILSILNIKYLFTQQILVVLMIGISFYICLNLFFGLHNSRLFIVGIGMIIPFVSYYITLKYFSNISPESRFTLLYFVLAIIILIKMIFDIGLYYDIVNRVTIPLFENNPLSDGNATYNVLDKQKNMLLTMFFITYKVAIYNYFTYFGFIYYLMIVLSINNILNKKYILVAVFMIIISYFIVINTNSRLFIYGLYSLPILLLWFFILKNRVSLDRHYILFVSLLIIITFFIGYYDLNIQVGPSLSYRFEHWRNYFDEWSILHLILPFLNDYRQTLRGSLHNELLELVSFFGLISLLYLWNLKKIFCEIENDFKISSFLLMFILIIGMLIQLNISNVYLGVIIGVVLALISKGDKHRE